MEKVTNPHDKYFKEILSRKKAARDFVLHYLPEGWWFGRGKGEGKK